MVALVASALALAAVAPLVAAQSGAYGQCGGIGWSGSTSCVSGYTCTYSNPYYSQCLPGSSPTTKSTTTTKPTTTTKSTTSPTPTTKSKVNYWFSFGDSYSQTGFVTTGTQPTVGNPLGNPGYPGYTAVGGVNYIDLVTVQYNKSLVLNYNLAYGGATIDANLVKPFESTVLSLTDQVNEFMSSYASKPAVAPWSSANTLFSVWIGINDIGNSYGSGGGSAFNTKLINAYFALVQKLYNAGARNFLFINVPPIDRSPLMLAQSTSSQALEKTTIADYNSQLNSAITKFKSSNSGVTTFTWDSNAAFTQILNNPKAYGFVDAVSYGNTGDFWGNNYHPSAAAHQYWGMDVGNQVLGNTVW